MLQRKFPNKIIRINKLKGGLEMELAISAPVLIRHNFCTKAGVVNGALATVLYVHQPTDEQKRQGQVEYVLVALDKYKGNVWVELEDGRRGLPILRTKPPDRKNIHDKKEKIFPLALAWSFTLHKIQGRQYNKLAFFWMTRRGFITWTTLHSRE